MGHSVHTTFLLASEPPAKFSKWEGLDRTSVFRLGLLGKKGENFFRAGCNFLTKIA